MKTKLPFLIVFSLFFSLIGNAQNCGDIFYDSGGPSQNYENNETITTTICPDNTGEVVTVTFSSFDIEYNYDILSIYDSDSTSNLLGNFTGTNSPETITASLFYGGCLTFVFTSEEFITRPGWEASVNCVVPLACGDMFYDSGGVSQNYEYNETITTTICPENAGEVVTVVFSSFDIGNSSDILTIYDGNFSSNLLGHFTGTNSPEIITASLSNGGCLTFVFTSDEFGTQSGWEAFVNCGVPPICIAPNNFLVDGTTETTATLYWTEINDPQATEWEIEYGITGFTQGTGTLETVNTYVPTITGLLTGTTYDVYVRANCGTDDSSYWSTAISFTTGGVLNVMQHSIDSIIIYPNPTKNSVFIKMNALQTDISICLFTLQGQEVLKKENITDFEQIDISNLENGIYFLTISNNIHSFTKKIIKE